jgi:hypothetical protein
VKAAFATKSQGVFRYVNAFGITILRKQQQVCARAATHVENAWTPIDNAPANVGDE